MPKKKMKQMPEPTPTYVYCLVSKFGIAKKDGDEYTVIKESIKKLGPLISPQPPEIIIAANLVALLDAVGELVGREIEKKALEALKYCVMRLETVDEEEPEEDLPEAMKELVREVNIDIDVSMAEPEDLELPDESDESSKD